MNFYVFVTFFSNFPPVPTYSKYLEGRSEVLLCLTHDRSFLLSPYTISKCVNKYSLILTHCIKRPAILSNIQKIIPKYCLRGE